MVTEQRQLSLVLWISSISDLSWSPLDAQNPPVPFSPGAVMGVSSHWALKRHCMLHTTLSKLCAAYTHNSSLTLMILLFSIYRRRNWGKVVKLLTQCYISINAGAKTPTQSWLTGWYSPDIAPAAFPNNPSGLRLLHQILPGLSDQLLSGWPCNNELYWISSLGERRLHFTGWLWNNVLAERNDTHEGTFRVSFWQKCMILDKSWPHKAWFYHL